MFEKEIQFITDFNLNKIKTLGKSFTLDDLFSSELHPAIRKYISGRIDYMIFEERKLLLENSRFDYSGSKISGYFDLIADEIKKTKKLSFNDVEEFIKKGVVFNANLCVQPKTTLINLVFKESGITNSTAEIRVYLNYIYYYDYYRSIINKYAAKRKIVNLSQDEFSILIDKIDKQLFSSKRDDIISDALNSISDFYNDGGISKSTLQPALVEAYLREKNLNSMIEALNNQIRDSKNKINISELKKIIFSAAEKKDEIKIPEVSEIIEKKDIKTDPDEVIKTDSPEINVSNFNIDEDKPEIKVSLEENRPDSFNKNEGYHSEKKEPLLNKEPVEEKSIPPFKEEVEADKDEIIFDDEISDIPNHKNEIDMEELIESESPVKKEITKAKDIFSFLTQKDIEKIVGTIFNDDEDDFASTLEKISESGNYEKAAEILQSVFYTYRVNPYKREAVILTNAVSNYFDQA